MVKTEADIIRADITLVPWQSSDRLLN